MTNKKTEIYVEFRDLEGQWVRWNMFTTYKLVGFARRELKNAKHDHPMFDFRIVKSTREIIT